MTDLTLPGSIPGLLRRGGPVLEGATECVIVSIGDVDDAGVPYAMAAECVAEHVNCCPLGDLSLDLRSATGRAHAAWWLAGEEAGGPWPCQALWVGGADGPKGKRYGVWRVKYYSITWPLRGGTGSHPYVARDVPALAALDPDDPRTLSDGSRMVDALALRLVCLHVAGMGVES